MILLQEPFDGFMDSKPFEFPRELKKSEPQKKIWTSYFKEEEKENEKFHRTTSRYTYTTSSPLSNGIEMRNDEMGEFFDDIYDNFSDLSQIGPTWESYKF